MSIYRVTYQSMTAFYGPTFIEAESADEARTKFNAKGAFSRSEAGLIRAVRITLADYERAIEESRP